MTKHKIEDAVLFPLADALGMHLSVKGVEVRGAVSRMVSALGMGTKFHFKLNVISSVVDMTGEDVGLLLEGPGDFLVWAVYSDFSSTTEIDIIDRTKLKHKDVKKMYKMTGGLSGFFEQFKVRSYGGAMSRLKDGIVASFYNTIETGKDKRVTVWEKAKPGMLAAG